MNKLKLFALLSIATVLLVGCQNNRYQQEAGISAAWSMPDQNGGMHAVYEFNTNGALTKIAVSVTNATEASLLDSSSIKSLSVISKSDISAVGKREGMLDNNAGLEGKAATESKLDKIIVELGKLKSPIPIP
jgi:hypothetical protein